jgi:hypothetical protein
VPAVRAVPTQACSIVIAMIATSAANEKLIFSITNRLYCGAPKGSEKTSPFFEIARVLVRFDHVA